MLGIWLGAMGVPQEDAGVAAAGWGGDRLSVAQGPGDEWAMAWRIGWDTTAQAEEFSEAYDQITARAMDTLAGILAVGGHLLAPGGRLLAMKGQRPDAEIAALPPGWRVESVQALTVPGLEGDRHLVTVTRDPAKAA